MTIYIALLRGINVGGKNKIKMADLRSTLETIGLRQVQTYIQSGNILFASDEEVQPLREKIEQGIVNGFGISSSVILRTAAEWERIIRDCPFTEAEIAEADAASDAESFYVLLLQEAVTEEAIDRIKGYQAEGEQYRATGREIYFLFHHSVRDSKLASNLHKLGGPQTMRNWNTMRKLAELAEAMKA
ncbi:DUF1697 domain-containing protein [Paenibacillus thermotolerans]|uniref:DUF1697 domain-containing protein n=1 Tax=Paenibacillus thermotolerans TaxID=3027807 RepID=UPI0023689F2E|nr:MULTISPECIES: DUF1697 domain-containing protein [unclassified Paenibacillus]